MSKGQKTSVKAQECVVIMPDGARKAYTKDELLSYIDSIVDDNLFHARKWGYGEACKERYRTAAAAYRETIVEAFAPSVSPEFQWDAATALPVSPAFSWDEYREQERTAAIEQQEQEEK